MKKTIAMMLAAAAIAAQGQYYWDAEGYQGKTPASPRVDGSGVWDDTSYLWQDGNGDYVTHCNDNNDWDNATYFGGASGDGGVIAIQEGGITTRYIQLDKSYAFTGGVLRASTLWDLEFQNRGPNIGGNAYSAVTGRIDVAVDASGSPSRMVKFQGSPFIITKPQYGDRPVSFSSGYSYGGFHLSGKEASFTTGELTTGGYYMSMSSDGALNAARILPNNLGGWGAQIWFANRLDWVTGDRFVMTGDWVSPSVPYYVNGILGSTLVIEGSITNAGYIGFNNESQGYFYINSENDCTASTTLVGGRVVLGHQNALGNAQINLRSIVWAPGVTTDISGLFTPDAGGMTLDVGGNAVVFTNAFVGNGYLGLKGKPSGSLTLRPPAPVTLLQGSDLNFYGGTLVLDFSEMPLVGGWASNLVGVAGQWSGMGGTVHLKGAPSGSSYQDVGRLNLPWGGLSTFVLEDGGGAGTYLDLHTFNRNDSSAVEITLLGDNCYITGYDGAYVVIRAPDGKWSHAQNSGGYLAPRTTYYPPTDNAWNYIKLSGTMAMDPNSSAWGCGHAFKAEAYTEDCIFDLGGKSMSMENSLLTDGNYDVILKNGTLWRGHGNDGLLFFVCGKGSLTLSPDVGIWERTPIFKAGTGLMRILGPVKSDHAFIIAKGSVAIGDSESLGTLPDPRSLNREIMVGCEAVLTVLEDALDVQRNIWFDAERTLTVDVPDGKTLTLSGIINGNNGDGSICKIGGGTLILTNAANSYLGGTEFKEGTISVSSLKVLGHPSCHGLHFSGGVLQITGTDCDTIDNVYVGNWGSFDGGFDIDEAGHVFTVGSPVTVADTFITAGAGMLALEGGITLGAGTTLRVVGNAEGNGGIVVDELDLGAATLEVVADKAVTEVVIATVAGAYTPPLSVKLPAGFALKHRGGKVIAKKDSGSLILVR